MTDQQQSMPTQCLGTNSSDKAHCSERERTHILIRLLQNETVPEDQRKGGTKKGQLNDRSTTKYANSMLRD